MALSAKCQIITCVIIISGFISFAVLKKAKSDHLTRRRGLKQNQNAISEADFQQMMKKDFRLAKTQSFGLFDNIRSEDWHRMQDRVKNRRNHLFLKHPTVNMIYARRWYMFNFDPDFTCPHERRVSAQGGYGDGGKWVCDPHRIADQVTQRKREGGNGCLIYSVGSMGNFEFEMAIQEAIGVQERCEIHVFDIDDYAGVSPPNVHFHHWGFKSSRDGATTVQGELRGVAWDDKDPPPLKSLQETIDILGHRGRTIDIFKIDCEGCEWDTFEDWLDADVQMNQILVEVHKAPPEAMTFFERMQQEGYVTFHKEPNTSGLLNSVEYAFLRLRKEFSQ